MKTKGTLILLILAVSLVSNSADSIIVPGSADPWLAGMTNGSTDIYEGYVDIAPTESPVLAPGVALLPGMVLTFTASGGVSRGPGFPLQPPDGALDVLGSHLAGPVNGIATITVPMESLLGVFLGPDQPDLSATPTNLDFTTTTSRYALVIQPGLKQPFFIGDGLSTNGLAQSFIVPAGATRLFLAAMDGYGWINNLGQFSVDVQAPTFLAIQNLAGQAAITVGGQVGSTNIIQYSTNLSDAHWLTLTNIVLSNTPSSFIDPESPTTGQRFYRAVRDP